MHNMYIIHVLLRVQVLLHGQVVPLDHEGQGVEDAHGVGELVLVLLLLQDVLLGQHAQQAHGPHGLDAHGQVNELVAGGLPHARVVPVDHGRLLIIIAISNNSY